MRERKPKRAILVTKVDKKTLRWWHLMVSGRHLLLTIVWFWDKWWRCWWNCQLRCWPIIWRPNTGYCTWWWRHRDGTNWTWDNMNLGPAKSISKAWNKSNTTSRLCPNTIWNIYFICLLNCLNWNTAASWRWFVGDWLYWRNIRWTLTRICHYWTTSISSNITNNWWNIFFKCFLVVSNENQ